MSKIDKVVRPRSVIATAAEVIAMSQTESEVWARAHAPHSDEFIASLGMPEVEEVADYWANLAVTRERELRSERERSVRIVASLLGLLAFFVVLFVLAATHVIAYR